MPDFRTEHDSMGDVLVPAQAYYGAQTQRAVENFPISGWSLPPALIHALGLVKYACGVFDPYCVVHQRVFDRGSTIVVQTGIRCAIHSAIEDDTRVVIACVSVADAATVQ